MVYLDTSFLIPYYVAEPTSAAVEGVLREMTGRSLFVSAWTRVEFTSSMARQVRMGNFSHAQADTYIDTLAQDITSSYHLLPLDDADYALASQLLMHDPMLGLRGPDALHLAAAHNHELTLYSLDRTLVHAAHALGHAATDADVL